MSVRLALLKEVGIKSLPEASLPTGEPSEGSSRLFSGGQVIAAFAILAAVLLGTLLLTRPQDPTLPPPANHQQSAPALTNAQAIERFKELNRIRIQAYEQRDLSLVPSIFVPGSSIARTVTKEIRTLLRKSVVPKPHFQTLSLTVTSNKADTVEVSQRVLVSGRFITESGKNVTIPSARERQTVHWTLERQNHGWLIASSLIVKSVRVKRQSS